MGEGETRKLKQAFQGRLEAPQEPQGLAQTASVTHTSIVQPLLGPPWTSHKAGASGHYHNPGPTHVFALAELLGYFQ